METIEKSVVLVVDDEPANIFLMEGLLTEEGFSVITAESGKEALEILSKEYVDVVMLDYMMPEMTGIEVLGKIVSINKIKDIPVIMVTAKSDAEDVKEALEKGAIDFIKKPINEVEMLARLRSVMRLKHQEDKLRSMIKSKDDFIRMVSHDLRSPFSSISGFAQLLLVDKDLNKSLNAEQKEYINIILDTSHFIFDYFNKLLNWSSLESTEIKLNIESISISKLIQTSTVIFKHKMDQKKITYQINLEEDFVLKVDPTYFSQVINNLLSNAVKFTPENGTISINAMKENGNILIKVIDTGMGITNITPEELFGKAFHKSTPGTDGEKGTGVGMHNCKKILDAHGFFITFKSIPLEGTEFIIKI